MCTCTLVFRFFFWYLNTPYTVIINEYHSAAVIVLRSPNNNYKTRYSVLQRKKILFSLSIIITCTYTSTAAVAKDTADCGYSTWTSRYFFGREKSLAVLLFMATRNPNIYLGGGGEEGWTNGQWINGMYKMATTGLIEMPRRKIHPRRVDVRRRLTLENVFWAQY